MIRKPYSAMHD